jgi:hypothetical protein
MEEHIMEIIELLRQVSMDINSAEVKMMKIKKKDEQLTSLEKRLNNLWQDAYHLRKDLENQIIP